MVTIQLLDFLSNFQSKTSPISNPICLAMKMGIVVLTEILSDFAFDTVDWLGNIRDILISRLIFMYINLPILLYTDSSTYNLYNILSTYPYEHKNSKSKTNNEDNKKFRGKFTPNDESSVDPSS